MGVVKSEPGETLMQMRTRIFDQQRRSGANAKALAGSSSEGLSLQSSKMGGTFSLHWRRAAHIHRHFAAKGCVLSYNNARETAISGALLYIQGLEREDLPPPQSRTVATMHDQRFHYCERLLSVRELRETRSPLFIIYDDASKRGASFLGSAVIGSRPDTSRFYEVLRVSRLRKDVVTDKTKTGLNGARGLVAGLEDFAGGMLHDLLWQIQVIMCDTTLGNTGTKILTGEGGSASHLRARIEKLTRGEDLQSQGHILVKQRDCLSHAGHNECEAGMMSLGFCADDRSYLSSKQSIDESKGSKRRGWLKNLLDELTEYVSDRPNLVRFIESEEELQNKALCKPPAGVVTRWGYYGASATWYCFTTARVELIVQYALSNEERRTVEGQADVLDSELSPQDRIERVKRPGVRAMLSELASPSKRIALIIFAWYYGETLRPFLDYTQGGGELQLARAHRVIRRRLRLMAALKGASANDTADGPWHPKLKPIIDEFELRHTDQGFEHVKERAIARTFFTATHTDFLMRTRGWWSPMALIFSVLDKKGEAVLGAQELVKLAGAQGPMVSFAQLMAFDPKATKEQRKGMLHEGITAKMVVTAIRDTSYQGPCLAFLPDLWKHVVALSKMSPLTVLRDVPSLRPLYNLLLPLARHSPISNFRSEELMKVIGKVLKAQQRMRDETATRNAAAVSRDPDKLHYLTKELDLEASYAL